DSRRDASLRDTDSIQVILDTFRDQRNGFVFGTNPAGIEYDGQVTNEGEGSLGFGDDEGFNLNWDGAWEVQTAVSEIGWSAELAIPFRTLRFPKESLQSWGLNVQRNIRRRNETAFWAPLPRQHGLFRLSLAGAVTGIEVSSQRNLKIVPYVLAEGQESAGKSDGTGDAGIDLKYSITPSLTLDATYNTDFAQVEADELQINLDRFDLFFPEKRPFFLENAGLFAVGIPGELELFFSRRIGIGPDGEAVPILGGVRLSGKAGRTSVGFLQMRSESVEDTAPRNDFTVARMSRELPNRSSIGAIFVNRRGGGRLALDD
ncbi:MAG: carbohydrate binding family 9 domain-containing protein, partial [bacterium]|nr:carbohydrate binding family 9 domain-containing protein [bacterium]